jgi:hypothetical protein
MTMAGTRSGGEAAAATNKKKYGPDFYARIGAAGGKKGRSGGFAAGKEGRERARKYGAIGGRLSRRGKSELDEAA